MEYQTIIVILNLIVIESILSIDNASALAALVQHLPHKQRLKALRYGLLGAYLFRGICLFVASWLIQIIWLKIAGGAYLLYLTYDHFNSKKENGSNIRRISKGFIATVISVEILDLSLSIDNIFAAVALSNKFVIVMIGVAIGILAMRFVAGWFVKLIEKYPLLEDSAFIVIFLLGFKLIISGIVDYSTPFYAIKIIMGSRIFDLCFSAIMMAIFLYPIIIKRKKKIYAKDFNQHYY